RQLDPKATSLAGRRFHADRSSHALNTFLHESESDAGARIFIHWMEALKDAEYSIDVFRGDANAFVFNPESNHRSPAFGVDMDARRIAGLREFSRVAYQVGHHQVQGGF